MSKHEELIEKYINKVVEIAEEPTTHDISFGNEMLYKWEVMELLKKLKVDLNTCHKEL